VVAANGRAEKLLARRRPHSSARLEKGFDGALGKVQLAASAWKFPLWRPVGARTSASARGAGG
jgi:hypothetical protein